MRPIAGGLIAATLMAGCASVASAPALADPGQIAFRPCANSNDFGCGHLTVPLAPGTGAPGSVTLAIRRHRAPVGDATTAVIALAGGPGQAALPFSEQFASLLGPIISTRDLIVFDQRGTGLSQPLSCHRFDRATNALSGRAVAECAAQIGPSRADYTTADSVADIEAIRAAGGYEKLVLYGTSYGTKLAEEYAQRYPNRVEALVLDSVVTPNGPDPLNRSTFAAIPRVLRQLCAGRACAGITPNPTADLWRLVAELARRKLRGRWFDGDGRGHRVAISATGLLEVLLDGDLEPTLRAEFPAAVRTAIHGDTAALARLIERANGVESEDEGPGGDFDVPLYFATTCEEEPFPWSRDSSPETRLAEAAAQIRAQPSRSLAPFTRAAVLAISDFPACSSWPYEAPAPAVEEAPLPSVPTLILSGAEDLRTPTANASEVAAKIPGSHLLVVPDVGHSVLGSDFGGCSVDALQALFAGKPIKSCRAPPLPPLLRPSPDPPARLADVAPARGTRGRPGRTLDAVVLTLADCERQLALKLAPLLASGQLQNIGSLRVGGLRAGWGETTREALLLRGYSYVSGVYVSGRLTASEVVLHVGGRAAAAGTLRLGGHGSLGGVLGGVAVRLNARVAHGLDAVAARAASAVLGRRRTAAAPAIGSSAARAPVLAFAAR